jgi:hypothetical protein
MPLTPTGLTVLDPGKSRAYELNHELCAWREDRCNTDAVPPP